MAQGVMIIAEQREGEIRKVSLEVVSEGKRLADKLGQKVTALLIGSSVRDKAPKLGQYGADKVIVADDPRLQYYTADSYVPLIADLVKANDPAIPLIGASVQGKDVAARLSARLGVGIAQDCTALDVESGNLVAIRPVYAGKAYAKVTSSSNTPHTATASASRDTLRTVQLISKGSISIRPSSRTPRSTSMSMAARGVSMTRSGPRTWPRRSLMQARISWPSTSTPSLTFPAT